MPTMNADTIYYWRNRLDDALEALKPMPAKNGSGRMKVNAKDAREHLRQLDAELREAWLNALQKER